MKNIMGTNNTCSHVHPQKSGSQMNGFLMGLMIGVLITLLFTTKKGRRILHLLTEEGMQKFTEVEEILQAIEEDRAAVDEDEFAPPTVAEDTTHIVVEEAPVPSKPHRVIKHLTTGRKFFRKPTKK